MLKLKKKRPPHVPVKLGDGAFIRVRPASQSDVELAGARAQRIVVGVLAGSEAAPLVAEIFGADFNADALADNARLVSINRRLSEMYLVMICQDGWSGILDQDDTEIEKPDPVSIALLLEDAVCHARIMAVINQGIHEEVAEKNVSSASPHGGADIPGGAMNADGAGTTAPSAGQSQTLIPESPSTALN